jgi:hypothetical protein
LYYGDEADEAVGKYLAQFDSAAQGEKHNRVKELLHLGLQALRGDLGDSGPNLTEIRGVIREELSLHNPPLNTDVILQAVRDALGDPGSGNKDENQSFTLSDVRSVVASVIATELDHRDIQIGQAEKDDDSEADKEVGRMSSGLLID